MLTSNPSREKREEYVYPPWDGKMSSNSFTWVTEGGELGTANWGCLAGSCASLCLQAAHGGRAAGGSG